MAAVLSMPCTAARMQEDLRLCDSASVANERMDNVYVSDCLRVQQWRRDLLAAQRTDSLRALHELKRDRKALSGLVDALAITEDLSTGAADLQACSERVAKSMRDAADGERQRAAHAVQFRQQLEGDRKARGEVAAVAEEALETQREQADRIQTDIGAHFALFEERLGLTVARAAPSVVRVSLSLIDRAAPEREFSFLVGLADPVTYCVSDCCPALPQTVLAPMLGRLNEVAMEPWALPSFICSLRRAFREAVSENHKRGGA